MIPSAIPGAPRRGFRHNVVMTNPDLVIVGAGAAGVGAGLELQARGVPFVILEAAGRVGGRAHTDTTSLPHVWDRGCHWLHCADVNPLVPWADRLGANYLREERIDHFMVWAKDRWASAAEAAEARAALVTALEAVERAGEAGRDVPVAEVLPDAGRWAPAVGHILQLLASEDAEKVSAVGYADYADTDVNWPVASGYGDLIGRMAAGLPIRTGVSVSAVTQRADGVRVETSAGAIEARAAIVTASTNVLLSGAIAFGPGPARDLLDLVQHVPCGAYEKVAIALERRLVDDDAKVFCMIEGGDGASPVDFQIAPRGEPLMIAHMAGSLARDFAAGGEAAMIDFAVERLVMAFGADVRKRIVGTAATGWRQDPFVGGAYSYAKPGCAADRWRMIEADTGTVAFAGEAFSRQWQATAHGAYQSGRDVAARMAQRMATGVVAR